jgi:hypothetical protein
MCFLKLDIAKAFDSVRWDNLFKGMQILGFGQKTEGPDMCTMSKCKESDAR